MRLRFICCILWAIPFFLAAQSQAPSGRHLIQDVRVFDGEAVLEHRSVLIENGKISQVYSRPVHLPNTDLVDGTGRTLLRGLFDAPCPHPQSS